MSRWAEMFAALSRGADTSDTSRHIGREPAQCRDVSTVSHLPTGRGEVSEESLAETAERNCRESVPRGGETEEERAAIVEYDSNVPRTWAEGFARLDPCQPPGDVPPKRWQRFIDDVGHFLDSPFCAVAAALGWGSLDLFGGDRDRPFARIDHMGLLWLLNGERLIMFADDAATIEIATGARQTWRRRPSEPGRMLAWELSRRTT